MFKGLTPVVRDPFIWWIGAYFFCTWLAATSLPSDVLGQNPWLQDLCNYISGWLPWIFRTAETFDKFPDIALLMLSSLWVTLPIQIGSVIWLSSVSSILRAEIIPWSSKYPIRFPVGIFVVIVIQFYLMSTMNAHDMETLSGWRAFFLSYVSKSQGWFGFGIGFIFFATSFLTAIFFKSIFFVTRSSRIKNNH